MSRKNNIRNVKEYLLVQHSASYSFTDILIGRYDPYDIIKFTRLANTMTRFELLLLQTLNFENMWPICFKPRNEIFIRHGREAFKRLLSEHERGLLYNIIDRSLRTTTAEPLWEFPKGHKETGETPVTCACREFMEETSIARCDFRLIIGGRINRTIVDDRRYDFEYYYAVAQNNSFKTSIIEATCLSVCR